MVEHILVVLKEAISKNNPSYARNNLTLEEKDRIFKDDEILYKLEDELENEVDIDETMMDNVLLSLYDSNQAMAKVGNIETMPENQRVAVISCLPDDEMKFKFLFKIDDPYLRILALSNSSNDFKLAILITEEAHDKHNIYFGSSFGKLKVTDDEYINEISKRVNRDIFNLANKLSLSYQGNLLNQDQIITFLSTLSTDEQKITGVTILRDDIQQIGAIIKLFGEKKRVEVLSKLEKDGFLVDDLFKAAVISSLSESEQLTYLSKLNNSYARYGIIAGMSDKNKIKALKNEISMYNKSMSQKFSNTITAASEFEILSTYSIAELLDSINLENQELKNEPIIEIFNRFKNSNSLELSSLMPELILPILSSTNPVEKFDKIEKVFQKNNLPMLGKEFLCFQILYPEFQKNQYGTEVFDFTEESRISPELLHPTQTRKMKAVSRNATDKDIRFQIVFNDLLRIASRSNNRSLIEYLNNIEYGNTLFLGISKGIIKFNDLDDKSKQTLDVFSNHLAALYENTKKGSEEIFENLSTVEKVTYFSQKFSPTSRYDLPDRIVRSFAYQAGIESFEQLKNIVINSVREKEAVSKKKSEELKQGKKLVLEPGDFVRAIGNIDCVESSLNNGNVCKEFLGTFLGKSDSDTTPLDVDLTLITEENTDIYHNIKGTPTGFGFGNIYVVLKKDNPNLNITRDKEGNLTGNEYDPSKVEVFGTKTLKGGYETHWGARTGIASSDIDYILFKEDLTIDPENPYSEDGKVNYILPKSEFEKKEYYENHQNDLAILKNEVVKNGFYIPIVDFSGKIIFTDEEYQELKQKMEGLSHYGSKEYHLKQHQYSDYTERIKGLLASNKRETKIQSQKVYQALSDIIQSIPIDETTKTLQAKNKIGIDLTPGSVEVLETGSSVRGTNVPYDFDFDYIFRLDSNIINDDEKMHQFRTKICEALNIASVPSGDFRDVEATIPGLGTIKLDITFIQKNDKVEYSTEMALQDRMDTIYKSNPAVGDEVIANIILAKLLLKQAGCYKPERKDPNQGGLGGVGIENWITQNGGTLETAANSFLKASEGKTYEEFKLIYHIHDYGKNHLYKEKKTYPYDDFIFNNMNSIGYQKMQEVLRKYIRYLSGEKDLFPELEEVLNALEQQQEKEVTTTHSRGLVSFFILISLSLFVSIITIIYILLRK